MTIKASPAVPEPASEESELELEEVVLSSFESLEVELVLVVLGALVVTGDAAAAATGDDPDHDG